MFTGTYSCPRWDTFSFGTQIRVLRVGNVSRFSNDTLNRQKEPLYLFLSSIQRWKSSLPPSESGVPIFVVSERKRSFAQVEKHCPFLSNCRTQLVLRISYTSFFLLFASLQRSVVVNQQKTLLPFSLRERCSTDDGDTVHDSFRLQGSLSLERKTDPHIMSRHSLINIYIYYFYR